MKKFAPLLILLLFAGTVRAQDEYVSGGDGYYYRGNVAYSRWWQPGYTTGGSCYGCGHYVPGYYFYRYSHQRQTYADVNVTVNLPGPKDANWRAKILDIVAARDEADAYQRALDSLGTRGGGSLYAHGSSYAASSYGIGSTAYGYNQQALQALYGGLDANVAMQQAARLTEKAQELAGQGLTGFQELIATDADGRNKSAQIIAGGLAKAAIIQAAHGTGSTVQGTQQQQGTTTVPAPVPPPVPKMPPADPQLPPPGNISQARQQVINTSCLACHNQAKHEGNLDLSNYDALPQEEKDVVFQRLTTDDPKLRMPRRADRSPGERLTRAQLSLFLQ